MLILGIFEDFILLQLLSLLLDEDFQFFYSDSDCFDHFLNLDWQLVEPKFLNFLRQDPWLRRHAFEMRPENHYAGSLKNQKMQESGDLAFFNFLKDADPNEANVNDADDAVCSERTSQSATIISNKPHSLK